MTGVIRLYLLEGQLPSFLQYGFWGSSTRVGNLRVNSHWWTGKMIKQSAVQKNWVSKSGLKLAWKILLKWRNSQEQDWEMLHLWQVHLAQSWSRCAQTHVQFWVIKACRCLQVSALIAMKCFGQSSDGECTFTEIPMARGWWGNVSKSDRSCYVSRHRFTGEI